MKFSTILAIAFCVAAVSAAPHRGHRDNGDVNYNHEVNTNTENNGKTEVNINDESKSIDQNIGDVGSTSNGGLLGGLLGGGIASNSNSENNVEQNANIGGGRHH